MLPRRPPIAILVVQNRMRCSVQKKPIRKLLIANRGEIACRVMRTARRLDIATIAIYSESDRDAMHVLFADYAYCVGPSASSLSYLNQERIFEIARRAQADAIHPGYGFLSENAAFADACVQNSLIFIGPSSSAMRAMGSKDKAKEIMLNSDIPVIDGYHGADQSDFKLKAEASRIGYPVMLKAVCSGGGKGMRIVVNEDDFFDHLHSARSEAKSSFGDDRMIVEKFIHSPRHVEMQIFGDDYGNYVHLFDRDCSAQRRCQKLIEEAPAPCLTDSTRQRMGKAAIAAAKSVNYVGAGTVEFLVSQNDERFYFMEMNTRLQVEHPVTEMITGLDLVEWQLRIASGEPLPILDQVLIERRGHSFEARVYAENPLDGFAPSPGKLVYFDLSSLHNLPNVRLEMGYQQGDHISSHYDPLIGKIITWGIDRTSALQCLYLALGNLRLSGVCSNVPFLLALCENRRLLQEGAMYTQFIGEHFDELLLQCKDKRWLHLATCWTHLGYYLTRRDPVRLYSSDPFKLADGFRINQESVDDKLILRSGEDVVTSCLRESPLFFTIEVGSEVYEMGCVNSTVEVTDTCTVVKMDLEYGGERFSVISVWHDHRAKTYCSRFRTSAIDFEVTGPAYAESLSTDEPISEKDISAPLPGTIEEVKVSAGQQVRKGDTLLVMVAMKMEYCLKAPFNAAVERVLCRAGDSVPKGAKLIYLTDSDVAEN